MIKKILLAAVILIVVLVSIEVVKILQLKASVATYAAYWKQQIVKPGEFTYVALGDSTAQGIGASNPQNGYVGLLAKQITATTGKSVRIVNLSVSGARIEDVIQKQLPELKYYHADLVTIEIGANDVTQYNAASFKSQYTALAKALPAGTIISNMPYFGGRIRDNAQAISASNTIGSIAQTYHFQVANLQSETRDHQSVLNYSWDYFHPSNRGYKNWDAAFWNVIRPNLIAK